jgi:hypothetical protein
MPPLQALVALHGLWALVLFLFAVWAVRKWPPLYLALAGPVVTVLGLMGLLVLIKGEVLTWYVDVSPDQQKYIGQRLLFVLGTKTDLPVVQVILVGIALSFAARRHKPPVQ